MNAPDPHHWTLNSCFGAFLYRSGAFWNSFSTARNLVQNAPNWCNYFKSSCNDVLLEFFATNAPDPHNWTPSSCFHTLLSIWVHLGPFRYHTKLKAKRAKLVQLIQKFVQQHLVRIFRNERSRSTSLDPKLMFWCVSFCLVQLGPFRYCTKLGAKWANLVQLKQKFVPQISSEILKMNAPDPHIGP